jgi:hypothetical protein
MRSSSGYNQLRLSGASSYPQGLVERCIIFVPVPYTQEPQTKVAYSNPFEIDPSGGGNPMEQLEKCSLSIPDKTAVSSFISQHSDLLNVISAICPTLRKTFHSGDQFSLEVYSDPETLRESLKLFIRQNEYQDDILEKINSIRNEFRELIYKASTRLHITTDFNPPQ